MVCTQRETIHEPHTQPLVFIASAGGMLPKCPHCRHEQTDARCVHCIPAVPEATGNICNKCGEASWDVRDPVTEQWITQPDCVLVSLSTAEHVIVYYRPCSDRYTLALEDVAACVCSHLSQECSSSPPGTAVGG